MNGFDIKNKNLKYIFVMLCFLFSFTLSSCDVDEFLSESNDAKSGISEEAESTEYLPEVEESSRADKSSIDKETEIAETQETTEEVTLEITTQKVKRDRSNNNQKQEDNKDSSDEKKEETRDKLYDFTYKDIPKYAGESSVIINDNKPFLTKIYTGEFEEYSDLDEFGRCKTAFANVGLVTMPTEPRGEIGMVKPSGWHTVKYPELIEDRYLYNRCHLIGYQLAGENANEKNLITGTRYFNVNGMLPYENQVASYVNRTGNHVNYRVTPIFKGDDLVCRGVVIEAQSVEDNAEGICFCVFVYNVQPYIKIDYSTGDSKPNKEGRKIIKQSKENNSNTQNDNNSNNSKNTNSNENTDAGNKSESSCDYILNANTRKFHYPTCRSVGQMAEHNKIYFSGTREEVIDMGYDPCGNCRP